MASSHVFNIGLCFGKVRWSWLASLVLLAFLIILIITGTLIEIEP